LAGLPHDYPAHGPRARSRHLSVGAEDEGSRRWTVTRSRADPVATFVIPHESASPTIEELDVRFAPPLQSQETIELGVVEIALEPGHLPEDHVLHV
jgi:hypothetical protein